MSDYKVKHDDHAVEEERHDIGEDLGMPTIWGVTISFFFFCIAISAWLVGVFGKTARHENDIKVYHSEAEVLNATREAQRAVLHDSTVVDADKGMVSVTIDEAKREIVGRLINLQRNPPEATLGLDGNPAGAQPAAGNPCAAAEEQLNPCAPAEGGPEDEVLAEPGTAKGAMLGSH
ncbi:MAG: hypothetical protein R3F46_09545 [bacterium]